MLNSKKIKTLLEKINWLTNSFEENNYSNISALEKSLLKEKVIMFFDEIESIPTTITKDRAVNERKTDAASTPEKPKNIEPVVTAEAVKLEEPSPTIEIPNTEETKTPAPKVTPMIQLISEPEPPQKEVTKTPETPKTETVTSEVSKEESLRRKEEFRKNVNISNRDMREIIDLNKSFIFKAELFKQNNELYNQFINEMNTTRTEDNALIILNNWTMKMNWVREENKAYELLERAVEKRFLPLI